MEKSRKHTNYDIKNVHPEGVYARDYEIAKAMENTWDRMTDE